MENILQGQELLEFLIDSNPEEIKNNIEDIHPADILESLEFFDGDISEILTKLPDSVLAGIIEKAEYEDKHKLFEFFPSIRKKAIIAEMASDELVDLLETIDPLEANELLGSLDDHEAEEVKELMKFHPETAGGIMATEFIAIEENMSVKSTIEFLQKYGHEAETTNYLYVLDKKNILKGVVSLRDIVISNFETKISEITNSNVISVPTDMDQEEAARIFQKYGFTSLPVLDDNGRMLGIITSDDVMDILRDENTEDFERMAALAHNENDYLETSILGLAKRRIFWLLFLMISATFTGFIIQGFEDALTTVVVLAAFIPMLMDTGGNAGSQSATLIIRGMALGDIKIKDFFEISYKELRVSLIVGLTLGLINFFRILVINRDMLLGITVSSALVFTVILAKMVGCSLPIVAKVFKLDPAIMAAPIITTIVDALSLIVYFNLATVILKI